MVVRGGGGSLDTRTGSCRGAVEVAGGPGERVREGRSARPVWRFLRRGSCHDAVTYHCWLLEQGITMP